MEDLLAVRHLNPRTAPLRLVMNVAWAHMTKEAESWSVELMLANNDATEGYHRLAVSRLETLWKSGDIPDDQRPRIRRALFDARVALKAGTRD